MPCVTHMACHVSRTWHAMCHAHGMPCVTHMACHVSRTWHAMCHAHGMPCVTHMACHVSRTWHAMCHTHGLPCVTHMACHVSHMHRPFPCIVTHGFPCVTHMVRHVSSTWLAMCRPTPVASKYVKFRLSRNPTKFDWVARFCEMIPTVQSVLSSEIYKNPNFFLDYSDKLPFCPLFFFKKN